MFSDQTGTRVLRVVYGIPPHHFLKTKQEQKGGGVGTQPYTPIIVLPGLFAYRTETIPHPRCKLSSAQPNRCAKQVFLKRGTFPEAGTLQGSHRQSPGFLWHLVLGRTDSCHCTDTCCVLMTISLQCLCTTLTSCLHIPRDYKCMPLHPDFYMSSGDLVCA